MLKSMLRLEKIPTLGSFQNWYVPQKEKNYGYKQKKSKILIVNVEKILNHAPDEYYLLI